MKSNLLLSAAAFAFVSAFALAPSYAEDSNDQGTNAAPDASNSDATDSNAPGLGDIGDDTKYITGMYIIDKSTGTVYLMMPKDDAQALDNSESQDEDAATPETSDQSKGDKPAIPRSFVMSKTRVNI